MGNKEKTRMKYPDWKKIINQFESNCIECNEIISPGVDCLWMKDLGIKHIECPTGIQEESQLVIIDNEDKKLLGMG